MHRLISIVRHAAGMTAVISSAEGLDEPTSERVPHACRTGIVPLSKVPEALWPGRDKDEHSWRALGRVPGLGHRAALAIIRVLMGSVTQHQVAPSAPLRFTGVPIDVRPHLCHAEGEQALIAAIGKVIREVSEAEDLPAWHWGARAEVAALEPGFRTHFLWSLHLQPWPIIEAATAAYQALELVADAPLRDLCARLVSVAPIEDALATFDALLDLPPDERSHQLRLGLRARLVAAG